MRGTRTLSADLGPGICLVELSGLEPLTPCLQIAVSSCADIADLRSQPSLSDRGIPLLTGVNGTLMAKRSWFLAALFRAKTSECSRRRAVAEDFTANGCQT